MRHGICAVTFDHLHPVTKLPIDTITSTIDLHMRVHLTEAHVNFSQAGISR